MRFNVFFLSKHGWKEVKEVQPVKRETIQMAPMAPREDSPAVQEFSGQSQTGWMSKYNWVVCG